MRGANPPELPALTSLRFFAAMEVVLAHKGLPLGAYQAVVFFFVLSGFVLTYAYAADGKLRVSIRRFWLDRFARLAPAFYLCGALVAPFLVYGAIVKAAWGRLILDGTAMATFLPAPFIPQTLAWNPPAWSLGVEIFLYAIFPGLIGLCFRMRIGTMLIASCALLCATTSARLFLLWLNPGSESFLYHCPLFYLPHFMIGIGAARLLPFGPKPRFRMAVIFIALSGIAASAALDWSECDPLLAPAAAILIIGAAPLRTWLANRPLIHLGEVSYAIYILHWPLSLWWTQVEFRIIPGIAGNAWFDCCLYIGLVLATAFASLYLIERPARCMLHRLLQLAG
jgi:peptidoglycan/LPS O-acetylase OafA/YrhL